VSRSASESVRPRSLPARNISIRIVSACALSTLEDRERDSPRGDAKAEPGIRNTTS
jgi:hypothetical protein